MLLQQLVKLYAPHFFPFGRLESLPYIKFLLSG